MNELALKQETMPPQAMDVTMGFGSRGSFELIQRAATLLASSQLVPKEYQGNVANATIALEMAMRTGASPLAVMQNLYVVHGKPGWSSQFIIAAINGTGRYSPLRFTITDLGEKTVSTTLTYYEWNQATSRNVKKEKAVTEKIHDRICIAWAIEKDTKEKLESPPISIEMAVLEGWYSKDGSKWKTMAELMLRYRAATLFGRLYAPEILMGMKAYEEIIDIEGGEVVDIKSTSPHKSAPKSQPPPPEGGAAQSEQQTASELPPDPELIKAFNKKIPKSINRDYFDKFLAATAEGNGGITIDKLKATVQEQKQMGQLLTMFQSWSKENPDESQKKPEEPPQNTEGAAVQGSKEAEEEYAPKPCPNNPHITYLKSHCDNKCKNRKDCPVWPAQGQAGKEE